MVVGPSVSVTYPMDHGVVDLDLALLAGEDSLALSFSVVLSLFLLLSLPAVWVSRYGLWHEQVRRLTVHQGQRMAAVTKWVVKICCG